MTTPALREQILMPVADLVPYARNARTHSAAQVAQLAASIREFGWTNPVLIDETGGIIAGHGRVLAAREVGMHAVPCLRLTGLTEAQKRAYVLADNQLALNAGWDEALLAEELSALGAMEFDLSLIGLTDDDLQAYLSDITVIGGDRMDGGAKRTTNNLGIVGRTGAVGFHFGDLMVTIPHDVYNAVAQHVSAAGGDARDAIVAILRRGVGADA